MNLILCVISGQFSVMIMWCLCHVIMHIMITYDRHMFDYVYVQLSWSLYDVCCIKVMIIMLKIDGVCTWLCVWLWADYDVIIWSFCNLIDEICIMVCMCIYVWNLVLKRWSLNQDLCHDVHVNGWWFLMMSSWWVLYEFFMSSWWVLYEFLMSSLWVLDEFFMSSIWIFMSSLWFLYEFFMVSWWVLYESWWVLYVSWWV